MNPSYILLEATEHGARFFMDYNKNVDHTTDPSYKIIGFANSVEDAQIALYGRTFQN